MSIDMKRLLAVFYNRFPYCEMDFVQDVSKGHLIAEIKLYHKGSLRSLEVPLLGPNPDMDMDMDIMADEIYYTLAKYLGE
jgi:hypothetical protein